MKVHTTYARRVNLGDYGEHAFYSVSIDKMFEGAALSDATKIAHELMAECEKAVVHAIHRNEPSSQVGTPPLEVQTQLDDLAAQSKAAPVQTETKTVAVAETKTAPVVPASPAPSPAPKAAAPATKPNGNGNGNGNGKKSVKRPDDPASPAQVSLYEKLSRRYEKSTGQLLDNAVGLAGAYFADISKGHASEIIDKALELVAKTDRTSKAESPNSAPGKKAFVLAQPRQLSYAESLINQLGRLIGETNTHDFVESTIKELCKGRVYPLPQLSSFKISKLIDALKKKVVESKNGELAHAGVAHDDNVPF
ncbi:MAG: hypothetical protein A3G34_10435 [Candidatus Lindowbacteria bacterium RIFCSPLOWO2_12_FULL_62_27]|nr:MAG: hypothetical protein A3G34_10435 [Candidatus Lindowbacteria bacterium RIFCSPLOWO2_12_FULL_62_27]